MSTEKSEKIMVTYFMVLHIFRTPPIAISKIFQIRSTLMCIQNHLMK